MHGHNIKSYIAHCWYNHFNFSCLHTQSSETDHSFSNMLAEFLSNQCPHSLQFYLSNLSILLRKQNKHRLFIIIFSWVSRFCNKMQHKVAEWKMLKQCFPFWINEHPSLGKPVFKCLLILINDPGNLQSIWSLSLLMSSCSKHANTGPCHYQLTILLPSLRSTSIKNISSLVTKGRMSLHLPISSIQIMLAIEGIIYLH